jgi:pimeloyl-ACP methyl ester carboxylesterase
MEKAAAATATSFARIATAAGGAVRVEYAWVGVRDAAAPTVVFLHEGLGSVAMWRGFPGEFCVANGLRGFVYSRPGYGRSTPRAASERWRPDFMAVHAGEVLPRLLRAVGIAHPWLFGHSYGATNALLNAARQRDLAGVVAVAPHLFVEDISVASIREARNAYETGNLRERLARYHDDVDSAFYGWNDVWLAPEFRGWNVEHELRTIRCPVLAVQGEDDEYGTLEQIRAVKRNVPHAQLLVLPSCGHSPHRDQAEALTREAGRFIAASNR